MEEKVIRYNRKAMYYLHKGNNDDSLSYLTKAHHLLRGIPLSQCAALMAITLNNLGCYHKSMNQPEQALIYLNQAIELEKNDPGEVNNLAATHLNLCAIESQMGFHLKALENCLKAIHLLKDLYTSSEKIAATFVTAHFNAGMEYKSLMRSLESRRILEIGLKISEQYLGHRHSLTEKFNQIVYCDSSPIVKIKSNSTNESPLKSIRSSTAATSIKKKKGTRREFDMSSELMDKNIGYKFSGKTASPVVSRKSDLLQTATLRKFKLKSKKINPKRNKKTKGGYLRKSSDKALQVEFGKVKEKMIFKDIRNNSAILIQKNWRMFITRKKYRMQLLTDQILEAEETMQSAYNRLEDLKSKKMMAEGKFINKYKDLIPVPYRSKLVSKSNENKLQISQRKKLQDNSVKKHQMIAKAKKIQSHIRGFLARRKYRSIVAKLIKIQKHWKGYYYRRKYKKLYSSTLKIQRFYRKYFSQPKRNESSVFSIFGLI